MVFIVLYDTRYQNNLIINKKLICKGVFRVKEKRWWILIIFIILAIIGIFKQGGQIKKAFKIGILQFTEHEALDSARQGFIDEIKNSGLEVEIDYKNAQADQSNCTLIANHFVSENCDLIFAIATPAAQSVAAVTNKIPILVTAITNPESANLVKSNEKPETNVSGTSDLAPIRKQIELIKKIKPDAKNIAVLYSSSEANSKFQAEIALNEANKLGLNTKEFTFSQITEIEPVIESMQGKIGAIYTPTDNMVASNMTLISKTALNLGIPVICGEDNLLAKGASGTFGVNYHELGKITGDQAKKILTGQGIPQNMPIEYLDNSKLFLNKKLLEKLNIKISDDLLKIAEITGE